MLWLSFQTSAISIVPRYFRTWINLGLFTIKKSDKLCTPWRTSLISTSSLHFSLQNKGTFKRGYLWSLLLFEFVKHCSIFLSETQLIIHSSLYLSTYNLLADEHIAGSFARQVALLNTHCITRRLKLHKVDSVYLARLELKWHGRT